MDHESTVPGAIAELDAIYGRLMALATEMAERFNTEAKEMLIGKGLKHIPIIMQVKQTSPNASSIIWTRIVFKKGVLGAKNSNYLKAVSKGGRGEKYPNSAFDFLNKDMKHLVLRYEKEAAAIREVASENRTVRRQVQASLRKTEKVLDEAFVE